MDDVLHPHPLQQPYPLLALLHDSALLREDIAGDCPGVPLALALKLSSAEPSARPLAHAAVYLWHADSHGRLHDERDGQHGGPDRIGRLTRLRGAQVSDAQGRVRFRTIYPGANGDGRALLHLQVYLSDAVHVTAIAHASIVLPQHETLRVQVRRGPIGMGFRPLLAGAPPGPLLDGIALDGNPSTGYQGRLTITVHSATHHRSNTSCRTTTTTPTD